ncbi:MAG TPA: hypothetical protein VF077_05700 [Nitrospiraceae bacterium]
MSFANAADANKFLDGTTISVTDGDDDGEQTSAEQIIRAYLTYRVPTATMANWDVSVLPASVPPLIREIAGRLVAAYRYRKLASEDNGSIAQYAQALYNEAIGMLDGILSGKLSIPEVDPTTMDGTSHLEDGMFYPNDAATDPFPVQLNPDGSDYAYKFGMGSIF